MPTISILTGIFSKKRYQEEYLHFLANNLNEKYSDKIDCDLSLNLDTDNDENHSVKLGYKYKSNHQIIDTALYSDLEDVLEDAIQQYITRLSCEHNMIRSLTKDGDVIPDGRGSCSKCGVNQADLFDVIPDKQIVQDKINNVYVAKNNWKKTFIQCGGQGLVLSASKGGYRTAFFEAFPNIDGYDTFIRGEGETIREAEINAFKKYQVYLSCPGHKFERLHRGKHRSDGYGTCAVCNLSSSRAFEPETKCYICQKPTTKEYQDKYVCITDYYALGFEKIMEEHSSVIKGWQENPSSFMGDVDIEEETWIQYIEFKFYTLLINHMSEKEIEDNDADITKISFNIEYLLGKNVYKIEAFKDNKGKYPSVENNQVIEDTFIHIEKNIEKLISYIRDDKKKKDIASNLIIPEKYLKEKSE
jgi:hypothetical protein